MKRDETAGLEGPRDLERVPEDGPAGGKPAADPGWLEAGAEDPAFFIKPSDED
jgi:hypothetical protein